MTRSLAEVCLLLAFALLLGNVEAADDSSADGRSLERALARLINVHALPLHMIVGERSEGGCSLALDRNFRRAGEKTLAAAQDRILRELELSNVQRDIRRFNMPRSPADESLFRVDTVCTPMEYVPQVSEFKPPNSRWPGRLTVAYETPPAQGTGIEIDVDVLGSKKRHTLAVFRQLPNTGPSVLDLAAPGKSVAVGEDDLIVKWGNQVLVDWSLGRWPMLRSAVGNKNFRLRVRAGASLAESNGATTATAGSRMAFPEGAVLTVLRFNSSGVPVPIAQVSWRQVRASQVLYSRDSHGREFWGRSPSNFEAQIVQSLRTGSRTTETPLILTLRPELDELLTRALSVAADATKDRWWEVYGSVVLMDAVSGNYISAGGIPAAPRPRSLPNEPFVADERFREEFLHRRPIGSVAKAPISHAIIASTPGLAGLTMEKYPSGPQKSILGISLDHEFDEHGNPYRCAKVDFECFLKESLNRYAATLLTLAAIPDLDQGDLVYKLRGVKALGREAFSVAGPERSFSVEHQPSGLLWMRTPSGEQLLGLPWVRYVRSQYDVDVSLSGNTGFASQAVHDYMWRNAFPVGVASESWNVQMIAPERENLRLDQARNLRASYLPLILGGGESLWSSAKVAEVFARTVTGDRVMGSFIRADRSTNWARLANVDNAEVAQARRRYLAGLQEVFVSGTGAQGSSRVFATNVRALKERAGAAGLELKIYAKSGTPTLEGQEADDDEDEYLHPIDRAYRSGLLSAVPSAQGLQVYLEGQLIGPELLARLGTKKAPATVPAPLTLRHLRYLASFNALDKERQGLMCQVKGGSFSCESSRVEFRKGDPSIRQGRRSHKGTGRNYAVYAELLNPATGKVCRAISMAVSFSEKGAVFNDLMSSLLKPVDGPLSRALGLDGARYRPAGCSEVG